MIEEQATKKIKIEHTGEDGGGDGELKTKIANQIQYYFSDVNLVKDKFMQEQLKKNDNCVKLSVLATFARLAKLTKDENVMIEALKDVKSDLIEVDGNEKLIKRKKPLPDKEEYEKQLALRTVHISGFPDSLKFDDLHRFCSKFGEVESVSMRQHFKTKQFKGCIHVVFKNVDDAKGVLVGEPLKFKDRELRRESMKEYGRRKDEMREKRMEKRKNKKGDFVKSKKDEDEPKNKESDSVQPKKEQDDLNEKESDSVQPKKEQDGLNDKESDPVQTEKVQEELKNEDGDLLQPKKEQEE